MGIVFLIFLVPAVFMFFRRRRIARVDSSTYPEHPRDDVLRWRKLELRSIDLYLLAIVFLLSAWPLFSHGSTAEDAVRWARSAGADAAMVCLLGFIASLVASAV